MATLKVNLEDYNIGRTNIVWSVQVSRKTLPKLQIEPLIMQTILQIGQFCI